jgi:hypothetical protein
MTGFWRNGLALAVALGLTAAPARAAEGDWEGLFLCTVVAKGGEKAETSLTEIGEKKLIAVSTYRGGRLTEVYPRGFGVTRQCNMAGNVLVCEIEGSMTRDIVFDRSSGKLVNPRGFEDGYIEYKCEPYTF